MFMGGQQYDSGWALLCLRVGNNKILGGHYCVPRWASIRLWVGIIVAMGGEQ